MGVAREKNWRHSFTATYYILDVETQNVEPLVPLDAGARIQLAQWSPQSNAIAYTRDDNNLYIRKLDGDSKQKITQVTRNGGGEYFNGVPDWVYEEEVLQGREATWWSSDGKHLAYLGVARLGQLAGRRIKQCRSPQTGLTGLCRYQAPILHAASSFFLGAAGNVQVAGRRMPDWHGT